jgi:hypothetical protein
LVEKPIIRRSWLRFGKGASINYLQNNSTEKVWRISDSHRE